MFHRLSRVAFGFWVAVVFCHAVGECSTFGLVFVCHAFVFCGTVGECGAVGGCDSFGLGDAVGSGGVFGAFSADGFDVGGVGAGEGVRGSGRGCWFDE